MPGTTGWGPNKFTIPGLGKLVLMNRKARMGRNPATGASIKIPAKRVVKFRIAKAAKDAILGPTKQPAPVVLAGRDGHSMARLRARLYFTCLAGGHLAGLARVA